MFDPPSRARDGNVSPRFHSGYCQFIQVVLRYGKGPQTRGVCQTVAGGSPSGSLCSLPDLRLSLKSEEPVVLVSRTTVRVTDLE